MKKLLLATVAVAALSLNAVAVNAQQSGPGSTGGSSAPHAQSGAPAGGSNTQVPGPNTAGSSSQKSDDGGKSPDMRASEKTGAGSAQQGDSRPAPNAAQTQQNRNTQQGAQQQQQGTPQQSQRSDQNAPETTGSVSGGANITTEQRTQVTKSFTSVNVQPVTNVNFNVSTGTVIPQTIELHTLPPEIVRVVPAWRTYRYVLVRNQIVIIEPGSRKIITIIERSA